MTAERITVDTVLAYVSLNQKRFLILYAKGWLDVEIAKELKLSRERIRQYRVWLSLPKNERALDCTRCGTKLKPIHGMLGVLTRTGKALCPPCAVLNRAEVQHRWLLEKKHPCANCGEPAGGVTCRACYLSHRKLNAMKRKVPA